MSTIPETLTIEELDAARDEHHEWHGGGHCATCVAYEHEGDEEAGSAVFPCLPARLIATLDALSSEVVRVAEYGLGRDGCPFCGAVSKHNEAGHIFGPGDRSRACMAKQFGARDYVDGVHPEQQAGATFLAASQPVAEEGEPRTHLDPEYVFPDTAPVAGGLDVERLTSILFQMPMGMTSRKRAEHIARVYAASQPVAEERE